MDGVLGRVLINIGAGFQPLTVHALRGGRCLSSEPNRTSGNCDFRAGREFLFVFLGEVSYSQTMIHYWLVLKRMDCLS